MKFGLIIESNKEKVHSVNITLGPVSTRKITDTILLSILTFKKGFYQMIASNIHLEVSGIYFGNSSR